ncbi:hypothetical protein [Flavobacterium columnare]|uniref:hypothetical protein n=1 Tax=Flavobacterium columnare TaxID=996 RepID=UPI003BA109F5
MDTKLKKLLILLFILPLGGCKHTNKTHDKMTQENFSYGVGGSNAVPTIFVLIMPELQVLMVNKYSSNNTSFHR